MRQKTNKIFFILLMHAYCLQGQTELARLDLGRKEPLPAYFEYSSADGGLVTLGQTQLRSSRFQGVTKYDNSFTKEWSKEILEQNGHKEIDFLAVLGENIFVFVSEYIPRDRTIRTWYSQLDQEGNFLQKEKVIAALPDVKEHRTDLNYVLSLNKKKLLCYKTLNNNHDPEVILFYLFDAESGFEKEGRLELPYQDDKFQLRKIMVSNGGNIFLLGKEFNTNRVQNPDDFSFHLFRFDTGTNQMSTVTISEGDLYITDLSFKVDRDENVYLAGFYSEKRSDAIVGTIFHRLNDSLETEVASFQKFTEAFLSVFLSERQIGKGKELEYFYLDNIILRSDGGVLLVAEKFYTTYNSYLDIYGYWVDTKIYHYDDIIVNSVSAEGSLEWSSVVPKHQSSEIREYLSYTDVVSGSNLYLLYTYQPKKLSETIYFNTVDEAGNVSERQNLLPVSENEMLLTRASSQISNNTALAVYFQARNKIYSVIKLSFE